MLWGKIKTCNLSEKSSGKSRCSHMPNTSILSKEMYFKSSLKIFKTVAHTCNPNTQKVEIWRTAV
jgi:hypothetical protein